MVIDDRLAASDRQEYVVLQNCCSTTVNVSMQHFRYRFAFAYGRDGERERLFIEENAMVR